MTGTDRVQRPPAGTRRVGYSVAPGLLRDLIIITTGLASPAWLEAAAETPAVASFTALTATQQPPPLPEFDQILASLLRSRFAIRVPAAA